MSPQAKAGLARTHYTRASAAFETGDPVVGVTFMHLSAEAAVVALAELNGIATERQHWQTAEDAVHAVSHEHEGEGDVPERLDQ